MTTEIEPTRVEKFIKQMIPWAHGHQIKAITKFVLAIIEKQTGCQAELARIQGNQEAAAKQLSRLLHNPAAEAQRLRQVAVLAGLGQPSSALRSSPLDD
jgi:hypothetical protein